MKAIFIAYNQAYNEQIVDILDSFRQRGFTRWEDIEGRGSFNGEPHYGNHAWPVENHAILTFVKDEKAPLIMEALKKQDAETPDLGLKAFQWPIEAWME